MPKGIPKTEYNDRADYNRNRLRTHPRNEQGEKRKRALIKALGGKCARCDYIGPPETFDFDHIDPASKSISMGSALPSYSPDKLITEAKKCQLLCANCHRIKSREERQ